MSTEISYSLSKLLCLNLMRLNVMPGRGDQVLDLETKSDPKLFVILTDFKERVVFSFSNESFATDRY